MSVPPFRRTVPYEKIIQGFYPKFKRFQKLREEEQEKKTKIQ